MALEKFRTKVAVLLMDCAYYISRPAWLDYLDDNKNCEDCEMVCDPEWRCR